MYAHEAAKEFSLITAAELYSKNWEQRQRAFRDIQQHLSQISNGSKARRALNLTLPALVHGLNDKLFSVKKYSLKKIIFKRDLKKILYFKNLI